MKHCTTRQKVIALANFKKEPYSAIAQKTGISEKAISRIVRTHGLAKCPDYTETEEYILIHFHVLLCAPFIPHKTINALKIKQSRLRRQSPSVSINHNQSLSSNNKSLSTYASM